MTTPWTPKLVTGDDVCKAVQEILTAQVWRMVVALNLHDRLSEVSCWQQVPDLRALSSAVMPAGAITTPGLVEPPKRRGDGGYDAIWRVAVGIVDRGADHEETAYKARTWAAVIRAVLQRNPSLGGIGTSLMWRSEEYAQFSDKGSSRTLGGCAVAVDITVRDVIDVLGIVLDPDDPSNPPTPGGGGTVPPPYIPDPSIVESTHPTVSSRPLGV